MSADPLYFFNRIVVALAGPVANARVLGKGPKYQTAIHEAAHAVVARRLSFGVLSATAVPEVHPGGWRTEGCVVLGDPGASSTQLRSADVPMLCDRRIAVLGAAWGLPQPATWREILRCVRVQRERAEGLVTSNWLAIEALAFELLWERRLGPQEIDAVLERMSV